MVSPDLIPKRPQNKVQMDELKLRRSARKNNVIIIIRQEVKLSMKLPMFIDQLIHLTDLQPFVLS